MDVRLSAEQRALRESVVSLVDRLCPQSVADLDDTERRAKLDAAVAGAGWRELRAADEDGAPWASAVEAAIVAEELGRGLADGAYLGPTLAAELRRLAGAAAADGLETVVMTADLGAPAGAVGTGLSDGSVAVDARGAEMAVVLLSGESAHASGPVRLGSVRLGDAAVATDLTRPIARPEGELLPVAGSDTGLGADALRRWTALGLALSCADLVGVMRGTITLASDYAGVRRQYGSLIGSFQAVQHLLADAFVAMEGSRSVALHAAWAVDALPADEALAAAAVAKAYCARAARAVCETSIQVHGGIGNTWECLAHVYLRRALVSADLLGGTGASLDRLLDHYEMGPSDGLR
jgi:alkylation response protein AidB-like acyl-CoA dehydrogenase